MNGELRTYFGYDDVCCCDEDNKTGFVTVIGFFRIEVITGASGVDFAECYSRREVVEIDGIPVSFISLLLPPGIAEK